jgi:spore cortex biosynthesis protein YabQ
MYSVPQSEQLSIFVASLGLGFLLGVLYDVVRAIRLSLPYSKIATVIFDLLYCFLFGTITFLFILALNKGEVRFYIIAGEIIGALFYYISFGIAVIKIRDHVTAFLKKVYKLIFSIIRAPFRLLKRLFVAIKNKMLLLFKKSEKNSQKLRKKHLPKLRVYVYNLFGVFFTSAKSHRKDVGNLGNKEKSCKEEK